MRYSIEPSGCGDGQRQLFRRRGDTFHDATLLPISSDYCGSVAADSHFVLSLRNITLLREANTILKNVSWDIARGEHWVVLGANGSGKTSLMLIAALYLHPSAGEVVVEGERLGDTGVRELRQRIAYNSAAFASEIRPQLCAYEVVMTAKNAALETWWHHYEPADKVKAIDCLHQLGVGHLAEREISTLSSGEQQRVFLARTRMTEPSLVLLDEPSGRLDLGGREQLVEALEESIQQSPHISTALITHHVDEIPRGMTHLLALKAGEVIAKGPLTETLSSELLTECFSWPLELITRADGRFSAQSAKPVP
ncbi:MAG: ATP-binding cassette domain-containing protein [Actinobacteria bacterium]|nr:ATP-binding cassette domain-containing protein [Actinomycetota bacterium]MTH92584.1 ATP-binding cassette domain-containing protein [Actinomycetota bacterium]